MALLKGNVPKVSISFNRQTALWQCDFRWKGQRYRPSYFRGFPCRQKWMADEMAKDIEGQIKETHKLDMSRYRVRKTKPTLHQMKTYLDLVLADYRQKIRTGEVGHGYVRRLQGYAHNHINPILGHLDIREVTTIHIKRFLVGLSHLKKGTKKHIMAFLEKALKEASLPEMPEFPGYKKLPQRSPGWLTEDEQDLVLSKVPVIHRAIVQFIFYTGVRVSEARALQWQNVHLDRGIAYIKMTWTEAPEKRVAESLKDTTKTEKDRPVALGDDVIETLSSLPRTLRCPFVFAFRGKHYARSSLARIVRTALGDAGFKHIKPHEAGRHSFCSQALLRGASTREVQAQAGHSDIRTTEIYTHVLDEGLKRTVRRGKDAERSTHANRG